MITRLSSPDPENSSSAETTEEPGRGRRDPYSSKTTKSSWPRRTWSAIRSMATIFPRVIVKPNTTRGRPPGAHTSPTAPSTSAARAARGAPHDGSDLVEGQVEHVVQHERDPLGGSQRLEYHEQRETDRLGQERVVLGVDPGVAARDRLGRVRAPLQRLLGPRRARAQHVEAQPRDDRRQPSPEVLDSARVRAAEPYPGLLNGVVRLALRAEHAVGDRPEVTPVLLESLRQPGVFVHRSHSLDRSRRERGPLADVPAPPHHLTAPRTRGVRWSPNSRSLSFS